MGNDGEIAVSAVIPAYNAEQFISETIQSILDQTYPVCEIIVVDDGSADGTADVAAKFPRTRVIRRPNGGQGAARNTGIYASAGNWIGLLDHDDVWNPQKTELQIRHIRPDVGVIHGNQFEVIDFGKLWHRQVHIGPSGTLIRKQTLLDVGGFEESRAVMGVEDLNLWLKIALTDWQFVKSEPGLFSWRETGRNQSGDDFKMSTADLATIEMIGSKVKCDPVEVAKIKQASRVEYARNLMAEGRWDKAAELLRQCPPDLASRWLSIVSALKFNRLARRDFVAWLQFVDQGRGKRPCSGNCDLPEKQRKLCMDSCRQPLGRN
ncbi:MAG TPA: glycosyltransferase family A protein [Acidobacteriaceae bacterium]|nr:glycosyltransferase family A protein [Acidobacteriaceae bacterium]